MHEKNHRDNWLSWWPNGYNENQDADEDFVPDSEEIKMGLDPAKKCSCDLSSDGICERLKRFKEDYATDYECIAWKAETLWSPCSADEEDFSEFSSRIYQKGYCQNK